MSNEEFLQMVNNELDRLSSEENKYYMQLMQLRRTDPNSEQFKNIEYQCELLRARANELDCLENLPTYARIAAMSEIEIDELKKKQGKFASMTSEEIKRKLQDDVKYSSSYEYEIEKAKEPVSEFIELQALVASNPVTARQMASLMAQYYGLEEKQRQIEILINSRLNNTSEYLYVLLSNHLPQELFDFACGNNLPQELAKLQNLIERRNKLSKKIFKGKKTKLEIESLNSQIKKEQSLIHAIEEKEQEYQNYEVLKNEIAKQIRAFGGEKYQNVEIKLPLTMGTSDIYNGMLKVIAYAPAIINRKNVVNQVMQEAQHQADIKEAKLRGITVEELMQMRKQENIAEDQIETEEEISKRIRK
mgnify:CR=1 FL=1